MKDEHFLSILKYKKQGVENLLKGQKESIKEHQKEVNFRDRRIREIKVDIMLNDHVLDFIVECLDRLRFDSLEELK